MPINPEKWRNAKHESLPAISFDRCAAKTTSDKQPGTTVFDHCRNVGCVAGALVRLLPPSVRNALSECPELAAALHDIGKVSPGFALKYFRETVVRQYAPALATQAEFKTGHASISAAAIDRWLKTDPLTTPAAQAAAAHHGFADRGYPPDTAEVNGGPVWAEERRKLLSALSAYFGKNIEAARSANTTLLAGLTSVADWIGSDEAFFPSDSPPIQEGDPHATANHAVEQCGFPPARLIPGLHFEDVFGFAPRPAQAQFIEHVTSPGVYVLEAPMGIGKTEAALYAAYRLMQEGHHHGLYFALPTRLTSDRIHERVARFLGKITEGGAPRLAHGTAWLDAYGRGAMELAPGQAWFNPMKRALLYPYAVGTIDQALLGVMNVKHGFVRLFGLAGKVVILDELHSYDVYTGTLLDELVARLRGIGCTVIILSATLTAARRRRVLPDLDSDDPAYPLLAGKPADPGAPFAQPLPEPDPRRYRVRMENWDAPQVARQAAQAARNGLCVVCIANTVAQAQSWHAAVKSHMHADTFPVGLLHARFPQSRRQEIEDEWVTALGAETDNRPRGCVLIATQILEQSVDVDADWMLSELAPSDMLLQRMGRLWRHERASRPCGSPEIVIVTADPAACVTREAVTEALGRENCCVYAPYVLMRTHAEWRDRCNVCLPADIRGIIESTYADVETESPLMQTLHRELILHGEKLRSHACSAKDSVIGLPTRPDDERAATRYSDLPTRTVLLVRAVEETSGWHSEARVRLLDGTTLELSKCRPDFATTKVLHRQTVSIAAHLLPERGKAPQPVDWLAMHFFDKPLVLVQGEDGRLVCHDGPPTALRYTRDMGVERIRVTDKGIWKAEPADEVLTVDFFDKDESDW